jgi:hypothetical protein
MGRKHFWFSVVPIEETEEGTDRWAVEQGYVSMTPLSVDLTNEKGARRRNRSTTDRITLRKGDSRSVPLPYLWIMLISSNGRQWY